MKHDNDLQWFDLFRGISSIIVLIGHLRALTFETYASGNTDPIAQSFFFFTGFGHQAVVIFFVLSGFFIVRSIHESVISDRWDARAYSFNRLTRLWIVLIPALIMTLLWDTIGLLNFENSLAYAGKIPYLDVSPVGKLGIATFFGNIFFTQNILVSTYGSNGALWSLTNEFWYYLLFPLLYFAVVKYYNLAGRILLAVLAAAVIFFIGREITSYFIIWLMGALLYVLIRKGNPLAGSMWSISLSSLIFVITLVFIRLNKYPLVFNDFSLGATFVLLLTSLCGLSMNNSYLKRLASFLANISYTVYVFHLSFAVFISSLLLEERMKWSYGNLLYYLLLTTVVLVYCWFMYLLFERNTDTAKKHLRFFWKTYNSHLT